VIHVNNIKPPIYPQVAINLFRFKGYGWGYDWMGTPTPPFSIPASASNHGKVQLLLSTHNELLAYYRPTYSASWASRKTSEQNYYWKHSSYCRLYRL